MAKKDEIKLADVVSGIAQAAANAWDGSHDKRFVRNDEELVKIGLRREEGDVLKDSRIMDGFRVYFQGPNMCIKYHSTFLISEMHDNKFDEKIFAIIADIVKYIKKEYRKITGKSVSITPIKGLDIPIQAQYISQIKAWLFASKWYSIGGVEADEISVEEPDSIAAIKKRMDKSMKDWLNKGGAKDKKYRGV